MSNPLHLIDKSFKTKEDIQAFVLLLFIVFIVFTKCYMVFTGTGHALNAAVPHNKALYTTVNLGR